MKPYSPEAVMPPPLGEALEALPVWFVIGGQAVRCLCPYRPSNDVDFGVANGRDLEQLVAGLQQRGETEILERSDDTVHLRWRGIKVSVFLLAALVPFVEERRLTITGLLATKMHAILDRGLRRDFFDLYVVMQTQRLGISECLSAVREVYGPKVKDGLLLRALTYFDDAEREATLPGEGARDWKMVKDFFLTRAGSLLVPPGKPLAIQSHEVGVMSA
jgi:hypothetical protein